MADIHETATVGRFTVEIHYDDDPMSPREWDNIGRLCGLNRWTFNDHPADDVGHAYREARVGGPIIALPVRVDDGPYVIVSETSWDHAEGIYWAAIAETEAIGDHGIRDVSALRECMRSELATLNSYLAGDVYGYVVVDPDGHPVDSCWGYIGEPDYAMSEGMAAAEWANFKAAADWASLPEWVQETMLIAEGVR